MSEDNGKALSYKNLLLSRISELEVKYPQEIAEKRLLTDLAKLDTLLLTDESALCREFDNEASY